ncbi:MAG: hypothetical protein ABMB14_14820 [Myxococcota bacterium]
MAARATVLAILVGCTAERTFVEVPGAAEVPSLAGCTWTRYSYTDASEPETSWTYDRAGQLASVASWAGPDAPAIVTSYTWSAGCLAEVRRDEDTDGLRETAPASELDLYDCDRRSNPVRHEHALIQPDGSRYTLGVEAFSNTYDPDGRLLTVEQYADDVLVTVDDYTWTGDDRPLVVRREAPIAGSTTTTTWLWDHELLLGWSTVGTGNDTAVERVFDGRRLTDQYESLDDEPSLNVGWTFGGDDDPFPISEHTEVPIATGDGELAYGADPVDTGVDRRISVACAE